MPRDNRTRTDLKIIIVLLAVAWIGALITFSADGSPVGDSERRGR